MPNPFKKIRIKTLCVVGLLVFAWCVLIGRLFFIQIIDAKTYQAKCNNQANLKKETKPLRGTIYDRNGKALTIDVVNFSIAAHPYLIRNKTELALHLSQDLKGNAEKYQSLLSSNKTFVWLEKNVTLAQFQNFEYYEKYPGLAIDKKITRYYPLGEVAGQLLGFTDIDNRGIGGLELQFENILGGVPGWVTVQRDGWGRYFNRPDLPSKECIDGNDLTLTIDQEYQNILHEEIALAYTRNKADKALGIVINPNTGEILAMANVPAFDPNKPSEYPLSAQRNAVISDIFEPGSTFKVVTATAALENRVLQTNRKIDCNPGYIQVSNRIIRDHDRYQILTFAEVIQNSSNVGTIKVAQMVGRENVFGFIRKYGFGAKTNIAFPGEENGILHSLKNWTDLTLAQVAIGQGVSITALQLAFAYAAIANGGLLLKPQLIKCIKSKDGLTIYETRPSFIRRVASAETMSQLRELLRLTVRQGTGKFANINGLAIAGKTGTSQKVIGKTYSQTDYMATFVGFFPANRPKLLCVVVLDNPKGAVHTGGGVAAPVVREIFKRIVNQSDELFFEEPETPPVTQPPTNLVLESKPTRSLPSNHEAPTSGFRTALSSINQSSRMPDLYGKTLRQALAILQQTGLEKIEVEGTGVVVSQNPPAGTPVHAGIACRLILESSGSLFE